MTVMPAICGAGHPQHKSPQKTHGLYVPLQPAHSKCSQAVDENRNLAKLVDYPFGHTLFTSTHLLHLASTRAHPLPTPGS